jgi:hypothetical protein
MPARNAISIAEYREVQSVAKQVLDELGSTMGARDTERSIAVRAAAMLGDRGLPDTWYHDCPAFVLLGSRSCESLSGRVYRPAEELVGRQNLVTVDLSPRRGQIWGDCARSFCIENGRWTRMPGHPEFVEGLAAQRVLHAWLMDHAVPDMGASELFEAANQRVRSLGYENLDFAGNVGHSIVRTLEERRYLERGASVLLRDLNPFTFEPHIRRQIAGRWGFKHENIYAFDEAGVLLEV